MKARILTLLLLLFAGGVVFAADGDAPFRKRYSLEVGAGYGPFHMQIRNVSPSWEKQRELAQNGMEAQGDGTLCPALSLSGVWRYDPRWELVITGGISWSRHPVVQYETFGVDPQGQPRYDLNKGHPAGWMNSTPVGTLTCQWRIFWNPEWPVQPYSAFGFGLTTISELIPIPGITPVGVRYGGEHFYAFAEAPINTIALFAQFGVGWRF